MIRPKKEDFNNGDHITDWLYWEQKYTEALNNYIDSLEKQLNIHSVSKQSELLKALYEKHYEETGYISMTQDLAEGYLKSL